MIERKNFITNNQSNNKLEINPKLKSVTQSKLLKIINP